MRPVDQQREQGVSDSQKAPALGKRDEIPALLALLGGVGAGAGVEQRELQHAMRRLAHHLERDIASHREACESEFLEGRVPKHVGRDAGHRLGAGMVGNPAIRDRRKCRKLWPPHQPVAEQTGNEDKTLFYGGGLPRFLGSQPKDAPPSFPPPPKTTTTTPSLPRG